jgi:hypothetical protein
MRRSCSASAVARRDTPTIHGATAGTAPPQCKLSLCHPACASFARPVDILDSPRGAQPAQHIPERCAVVNARPRALQRRAYVAPGAGLRDTSPSAFFHYPRILRTRIMHSALSLAAPRIRGRQYRQLKRGVCGPGEHHRLRPHTPDRPAHVERDEDRVDVHSRTVSSNYYTPASHSQRPTIK